MSTLASTSRWTLDYTTAESSRSSVRDPPGYSPQLSVKDRAKAANVVTSKRPEVDLNELRQAKAWELALAPAKAVPMQAFMMYMSGGGIQIFSIMSVWFLLKQAVSGMMGVDKAFAPFEAASKAKVGAPKVEPQSFLEQKIVYVICQFGLLAVGLWKCNSMGILPTSAEDWAPVFGHFAGAGPVDAPAPGFMPIKVVPAPPLSSAVA
ncbi:hypothetical protein JCM3775_005337 [Rhodotorula graminis]|uniref:ER membrane protein complex subunit 4 n=1 Tax=Rhodotorula graminis (strain WP1) TaxID=578459 RepID=A0A0P9EJW8_RHOGW|nr:uncharacterized protein RHOBADRAFT_37802 [Rhodotorula graminis WP1]KPV73912.1 hypothetical protein RHOBADRAFT_37802 [Rhodotorula graminis WP1]